jgi:hypothetical protein
MSPTFCLGDADRGLLRHTQRNPERQRIIKDTMTPTVMPPIAPADNPPDSELALGGGTARVDELKTATCGVLLVVDIMATVELEALYLLLKNFEVSNLVITSDCR